MIGRKYATPPHGKSLEARRLGRGFQGSSGKGISPGAESSNSALRAHRSATLMTNHIPFFPNRTARTVVNNPWQRVPRTPPIPMPVRVAHSDHWGFLDRFDCVHATIIDPLFGFPSESRKNRRSFLLPRASPLVRPNANDANQHFNISHPLQHFSPISPIRLE